MPLWGKAAAGTQAQKPKWLSTDENSAYKKQDCVGESGGWAMRAGTAATGNGNTSAQQEIIVAIRGLAGSSKLAAPSITSARFITSSHTNGGSKTITVEVTWDEEVTVAGSPQIVLANGNQSTDGDGNATLTYTATGSTSNRKRFTNASLTLSTNDVYTLGGGSQADISLNSGTISDTTDGGTTTAALRVLTALSAQTITVTAS